LPVEGTLPSFDGATDWLNSPPLTPVGLRGKVVLVGGAQAPADWADLQSAEAGVEITFADAGARVYVVTFG
jgi:hypothetical protein